MGNWDPVDLPSHSDQWFSKESRCQDSINHQNIFIFSHRAHSELYPYDIICSTAYYTTFYALSNNAGIIKIDVVLTKFYSN